MPNTHEVFAHAPLALVTAQVSLSYEPALNKFDIRDEFSQRIRDQFPILSNEAGSTITFDLPSGQASTEPITLRRAANESRSTSASINAEQLTIETVEYDHFEPFLDLFRHCAEALNETVQSTHVSRVGLRYIDEIRVPGIATTRDWSGWVSDRLLAGFDLLPKYEVGGITAQVAFTTGDDNHTLIRWGEAQGTSVLAPNFPLRRTIPKSGRFFVLDIDSAWQPENPVPFNVEALTERLGSLHEPTSDAFFAAVTEKARNFFRGGEQA